MSVGSISLDILLNQICDDALAGTNDAVKEIRKRYPSLSEKEAMEIHSLIVSSMAKADSDAEVVVTAPPSFAMKTKVTKTVVKSMLENAKSSIVITGYSLSDYFSDLVDCIIRKSQEGVFVRFYVNHIEDQANFDKLCRHKSRFLRIYNYPKQDDAMSALHAKVISVDKKDNLITSANLSYHGQEGNIEMGIHVVSEDIAKQIDSVLTTLLFKKVFEEV